MRSRRRCGPRTWRSGPASSGRSCPRRPRCGAEVAAFVDGHVASLGPDAGGLDPRLLEVPGPSHREITASVTIARVSSPDRWRTRGRARRPIRSIPPSPVVTSIPLAANASRVRPGRSGPPPGMSAGPARARSPPSRRRRRSTRAAPGRGPTDDASRAGTAGIVHTSPGSARARCREMASRRACPPPAMITRSAPSRPVSAPQPMRLAKRAGPRHATCCTPARSRWPASCFFSCSSYTVRWVAAMSAARSSVGAGALSP